MIDINLLPPEKRKRGGFGPGAALLLCLLLALAVVGAAYTRYVYRILPDRQAEQAAAQAPEHSAQASTGKVVEAAPADSTAGTREEPASLPDAATAEPDRSTSPEPSSSQPPNEQSTRSSPQTGEEVGPSASSATMQEEPPSGAMTSPGTPPSTPGEPEIEQPPMPLVPTPPMGKSEEPESVAPPTEVKKEVEPKPESVTAQPVPSSPATPAAGDSAAAATAEAEPAASAAKEQEGLPPESASTSSPQSPPPEPEAEDAPVRQSAAEQSPAKIDEAALAVKREAATRRELTGWQRKIRVDGVAWSPAEPRAFVNGVALGVGDSLPAAAGEDAPTVAGISPNEVEFVYKGKRFSRKVELFGEER